MEAPQEVREVQEVQEVQEVREVQEVWGVRLRSSKLDRQWSTSLLPLLTPSPLKSR